MIARTAGFRIVRVQTERPGLGASGPSAFPTNTALPRPPPLLPPPFYMLNLRRYVLGISSAYLSRPVLFTSGNDA